MPIHLAEHELAGQCREAPAHGHQADHVQLAWDGVEGTTQSRTPPFFGCRHAAKAPDLLLLSIMAGV